MAGLALVVVVLALAGCGAGGDVAAHGEQLSRPRDPGSVSAEVLRGKVIVLDPGHNDGNFGHAKQIGRLVDAGGFRKPCNTTGTTAASGYTEAAFNFDVARRLVKVLRADGARVVLTRTDDHSVGPCVDERARIANKAHADAALSIHADGGPPDGHGFHVLEPTRGKGHHDSNVAPSHRLAVAVRDEYRSGTGLPPATYIGTDGLDPRADMAGLNLSTVPVVMVECGNMRNAHDARLLSTPAFRQKIADALAAGLTRYLG